MDTTLTPDTTVEEVLDAIDFDAPLPAPDPLSCIYAGMVRRSASPEDLALVRRSSRIGRQSARGPRRWSND